MINEYIINDLSRRISPKRTGNLSDHLSQLKRKASKIHKLPCPTNIELLRTYRAMLKNGKIKENKAIEKVLTTKDIRTSSGVAVIAVLTKPYPCPGSCVYCPSEKNMPKSYLSNEPAVMRAILTGFDPYGQVSARIRSLNVTGHETDKVELIVMGGTFSYLPEKYQEWFVSECFRACNDGKLKMKNEKIKIKENHLEALQKRNEKSKHRIVGLTLETRPDYIDEKEIIRMRKLGATRVELGVQSIYDDVLKLNKRGHGRAEVIKATKLLKDSGFKINYHMMPNLPGSNFKRDLQMFEEIFSNPDFQPDIIKIYPCVVVKNAEIYKWWKNGKYKPYSDKKLLDLLMEVKKNIPYYVRITRVIRDIPSTSIVAGNKISNLRQVLEKRSGEENWRCKCIRCREIRNNFVPLDKGGSRGVGNVELHLLRQDYEASQGKEIFLSFEDNSRKNLYSMLRLRINDHENKPAFPALKDSAIIREVHTYGKLVAVSAKSKRSPQHTGLGKKLMLEAERIAKKEFGLKKIAVISGVGVRNYYRKLGFKLKDGYMVKKI
ncbi:MAG: tRNA uridine(34) 5-carboxymethylaminomethyl modification radical SAM/GNAT enzyme Elp3 [Candidatus Paceibacterota bacterium]|jgi:elongator complex protein 3